MTHLILIPGLWLDASSWDKVVPTLEQAGHRTHPLTLPGMETDEADRSQVGLRDHIDAVIEAIDEVAGSGTDSDDHNEGKVVLVGHSAGCGIAHAAVDARPERVVRAVYIGGSPIGDGDTLAESPAEDGQVPLPDWSAFEDAELVDLGDRARGRVPRARDPVTRAGAQRRPAALRRATLRRARDRHLHRAHQPDAAGAGRAGTRTVAGAREDP